MRRMLNTLYITNPNAYLHKKDNSLSVSIESEEVINVPFHLLEGVVIISPARCSLPAMAACAEHGICVSILDNAGNFKARVEGPVSGNVLLRRAQYLIAADRIRNLEIAKRFVAAKLHNSQVVLQHYSRDYPDIKESINPVVRKIKESTTMIPNVSNHDELRGIEGDAAHLYFSVFGNLIRCGKEIEFEKRTKRPPLDPVNSMLSFIYSLLTREISGACEAVGLDPQMGFLHSCRPGRMSLALDIIEEFRSPIVDRFVLSAFNRKQLTDKDFVSDGGAVSLTKQGMKKTLGMWQEKKKELFTHPFLKESVEIGLLPFVQAQLFARFLRGDLDDYPACLWR
jgi:CRISPR-associated protein Cas1